MKIWSLRQNEKVILPNYSNVSTTVWLHHFECDETFGEKVKKELNKDAVFCFNEILYRSFYNTAAVRSLNTSIRKSPKFDDDDILSTAE